MRKVRNEIDDFRYREQQQLLRHLADELGIVMFLPDYHGKSRDANTVLFYTKEDAAHNAQVDKELTHYSRGEAQDLMRAWKQVIDDRYIYRDYIWCFQNLNVNGIIDMSYANYGRINLTYRSWVDTVRFELQKALNRHKARTGFRRIETDE